MGGVTAEDQGDYRIEASLSVGDDCQAPVPITIEKGANASLSGDTLGRKGDSGSECGGNNASDVVYEMTLPQPGYYAWILSASFNSVLTLKNGCKKGPLACKNEEGLGGEVLTFQVHETETPKKVFVWIDGSSGASGQYRLTVIPPQE